MKVLTKICEFLNVGSTPTEPKKQYSVLYILDYALNASVAQ